VSVAKVTPVNIPPHLPLQVNNHHARCTLQPDRGFDLLLNNVIELYKPESPDPMPDDRNVANLIKAASRHSSPPACPLKFLQALSSGAMWKMITRFIPFDTGPYTVHGSETAREIWTRRSSSGFRNFFGLSLRQNRVHTPMPQPWLRLGLSSIRPRTYDDTLTVSNIRASEVPYTGSTIRRGYLQKEAAAPFGPPPSVSFPDTPPNQNAKVLDSILILNLSIRELRG
jgi:hypothetical protein